MFLLLVMFSLFYIGFTLEVVSCNICIDIYEVPSVPASRLQDCTIQCQRFSEKDKTARHPGIRFSPQSIDFILNAGTLSDGWFLRLGYQCEPVCAKTAEQQVPHILGITGM